MKVVYKYELPFHDESFLILPDNAKILTVQNQHDVIVLYALVDANEKVSSTRKFRVAGTGHPIYDEEQGLNLDYIGTVQFSSGNLVFHVFEMRPE